MRALQHLLILKRELSRKAKLSVFQSIFVPITYDHESWVMTERVRSQMQASEMRFLQKSKVLTMFDNLRDTAIRESLKYRIATSPDRKISAYMVWPCK